MRSITRFRHFWIPFFILLSGFFPAFSEDKRSGPIDMYLLIDTSIALSSHYNEALNWIQRSVFEEVLQKEDTLTILSAGRQVKVLYQSRYMGPESIKDLVKLMQDLSIQEPSADFIGAIGEAKQRDADKANMDTLGIALMVTGTDETVHKAGINTRELENLLKYSKVEDFPGWKLIIIGLNMDDKVRTAARDYQAFVETLEQKAPSKKE